MEHRKSKLDVLSKRKNNNNKCATIEGAYSCLLKIILQAAEKTIPKASTEAKKRLSVLWQNEECERKERIVRAEYKKH